jgi:hypothetical protein
LNRSLGAPCGFLQKVAGYESQKRMKICHDMDLKPL